MKTKKLSVLLTFISAIIILIIIVASSTVAANAFVDGGTLILNERKKVYNVTDEYGMRDEQWFYYTPEDSRYYVAETSGGADTVLRVGNPYFEIVNDDLLPGNPNSRILFKAEAGRQFRVDVRFCYSSSVDEYSILQLRKQRFSMFGYVDHKGNNSAKDFGTPIDKFRGFYDCVSYENVPAYMVYNDDDRWLAPLNSEIFFFSGHGYTNGRGVVFYQNGEIVGNLTVDDSFFNMGETRIAMWAACCSANEPDSSPCIARKSVLAGAEVSVGFKKSITFSSSRTFTDKFFSKLAEGATVAEAASAGAGALPRGDDAKEYVLFGDGKIRVTDETPSGDEFYSLPANYEYLREELANGYVAEPLDGNDTRYYQTVNGYPTDSYIDITEVNGKITAVNDHRTAFDSVLEIDENYLNKGCAESVYADGQVYTMCEEDKEYIMYCNFGGVMTPVKISYVVYTGTNGEVYCEADCINLNDGSSIDYGDICGLKE